MLRTEQILNAKFTPISKGTYSADEVDAFLKTVAESFDELIGEKNELIKKISILADKVESYRNDEEAIKLSLLDAHRMAETVNKNAKEKADSLVSDAEGKSKIILDGANRQSAQIVSDARDKAKEIVDNARTAVTSLTERAQRETDQTISAAKAKANEIVADAEAEGKRIIGSSKKSYEFYTAEIAKMQDATSKFKASVEALCKGQLNLLDDIPQNLLNVINEAAQAVPEAVEAEEPAEEVLPVSEPVAEAPVEPVAEVPAVSDEPEEIPEEASAVPEEIEAEVVYTPDETAAEPESDDIIDSDAVEDEFESLIDSVGLEDFSASDSIPSSLDDLIPQAFKSEPEEKEEDAEAEDEEEFEGFSFDLDSLADDADSEKNDNDDDDITSLFDSMFDE